MLNPKVLPHASICILLALFIVVANNKIASGCYELIDGPSSCTDNFDPKCNDKICYQAQEPPDPTSICQNGQFPFLYGTFENTKDVGVTIHTGMKPCYWAMVCTSETATHLDENWGDFNCDGGHEAVLYCNGYSGGHNADFDIRSTPVDSCS